MAFNLDEWKTRVQERLDAWGNEFDPRRVNMDLGDEKVGGTSPVGIYPGGASPYGVEELSGNVWERCSSLYWNYPYDAGDGREDMETEGSRVLRGGSWADFDERFARCASRFIARPSLFAADDGFRVVVSSPHPS
jgi:formylglycine-generating enzyme required for sulfatase activity